jgi:hypothetical protein
MDDASTLSASLLGFWEEKREAKHVPDVRESRS